MPAQSSGAAPARSRLAGMRSDETLVDDDAVGVAAVGDRRGLVLVRRAVGEDHVRAELLEAVLAVGAGAVRIDQAADADEVARLELG